MNEQDFYKLKLKQVVYHNGVKKITKCLNWGSLHEENVAFDDNEGGLCWATIMKDCSLEPPFEIKEDCKHREPEGEPFCMHDERFINTLEAGANCFECKDYEPKKPFEVKEDCEHYRKDNTLDLCYDNGNNLLSPIMKEYKNCHECEDYEPKTKKDKRFFVNADISKGGDTTALVFMKSTASGLEVKKDFYGKDAEFLIKFLNDYDPKKKGIKKFYIPKSTTNDVHLENKINELVKAVNELNGVSG